MRVKRIARLEPTIGELRHRVTFEQPVKVEDGHGGYEITWAKFATVWARIEPLSGREYFYAHQTAAEVTHRIIVRYLRDITPSMRIIHNDDRQFEIEAILDPEERHEYLEIMASEAK